MSEAMPAKGETLLRVGMGIFMLLAGIGKLMSEGGVAGFAGAMSAPFAETMLPVGLAEAFLYLVPFIEVALGVWLLSGYKRVLGLFCTGVLFLIFILGQLLQGNMGAMADHFLYLIVIALALTMPGCCCVKQDK